MRWRVVAMVATLLALGSCERGSGIADGEVAAELRALRNTLQQRNATAAVPDRAAFAQAFAPLREAVQALVGEQAAIAERQLVLTQELQRWSQFVVSQAATNGQQELEGLRTRLQSLEQTLQAEKVRHAEVEQTVRKALDRTTEQLDALLQVLLPTAPEQVVPTPAPSQGKPEQGKQGDEPKRGAVSSLVDDADVAWLLLLLLVALAMAWLWWRRGRRVAAAKPTENVGLDRGVQEIWAAAELLGAAVGRLRESGQPEHEPAASDAFDESLAVAAELGFDDAPVPPPAVPPIAVQRAASAAPGRPTPPVACLFVVPLPADGQRAAVAALEQVLGADPRVLRRPAPEVVASEGRAAVRCCLLPSLPQAERSHLEQCLRDAVA